MMRSLFVVVGTVKKLCIVLVSGILGIGVGFTTEFCSDADYTNYYTWTPEVSSGARFPLTQEGQQLLQTLHTTKEPTTIIPDRANNEAICAGYVHDLSQLLRGPLSVSRMGMYHPERRTVCKARELPYCYWYMGGEVMVDIGDVHGPDLRRSPNRFPELVTQDQLKQRFEAMRNRQAYLGDLTFIYGQSQYLHMIGTYGNYNSHIGKHMGVSTFTSTVGSGRVTLQQHLGCSDDGWSVVVPTLEQYAFRVNGDQARILEDGTFVVAKRDDDIWQPSLLLSGDRVEYNDVLLAHFREGEKVESVLEFYCKEQFYPIAVVSVNEEIVGK